MHATKNCLTLQETDEKHWKKKKKHENWEKYQTKLINILILLLFHIEKLHFVRKHIWKKLFYIITFALQSFHVAGYWKCSNKTTMPI